MAMVPTPTPSISHSVLPTYTHSTVETRWLQMPSEGPSAVRRTEPTGMATNIPIAAAATVQASSAKRRRPEPAGSVPPAWSVALNGGASAKGGAAGRLPVA